MCYEFRSISFSGKVLNQITTVTPVTPKWPTEWLHLSPLWCLITYILSSSIAELTSLIPHKIHRPVYKIDMHPNLKSMWFTLHNICFSMGLAMFLYSISKVGSDKVYPSYQPKIAQLITYRVIKWHTRILMQKSSFQVERVRPLNCCWYNFLFSLNTVSRYIKTRVCTTDTHVSYLVVNFKYQQCINMQY